MSQEKKTSEAQLRASRKYLAGLDEIRIRFPKGRREEIKAAAAAVNESMNQFVTTAIDERIKRLEDGE